MAYKQLSASEVSGLFKEDRIRNTKYLHSVLSNSNSPSDNVDLILQFREQHPEKFLTDEEIAGNKNLFQRRRKQNYFFNKGQAVGGYSYNVYTGERSERRDPSFREYRASKFTPMGGKKNDPNQPLSVSRVNQLMFGLKSDYARTRYFQKVINNPESNSETIDNLIAWKDQHPEMMMSEEAAKKMSEERKRTNNPYRVKRPYYPGNQSAGGKRFFNGSWRFKAPRDYDKESFDAAWASKEEFDTYSAKHKSLLSRFIKSKDRNKNSKLALKILSSGNSSDEDVEAVRKIVASRPKLFFKGKS